MKGIYSKSVQTLTLIHYASGGGASDDDDEWGDFGDDDDFGFDVEVKKKKKEKVKEKIKEGKGEERNCFQITFSQKIQFLVYFFKRKVFRFHIGTCFAPCNI